MTPYRSNAKLAIPKPSFPYRVVYDGYGPGWTIEKEPFFTSLHRYHWSAWLAAKWYCLTNEYGSAIIQVRK